MSEIATRQKAGAGESNDDADDADAPDADDADRLQPWSFKGVDQFGAVDAQAMRAWIARQDNQESLRS